ncbi:MAG: hypothetical protein WCA34_12675 [Candidatus Acidiferrales bacterium]
MCSRPKFAAYNAARLRPGIIAVLFLAFVSLLAGAQASRGQQAPPGAIGRVEGNDVSVDNGTTGDSSPTSATPGSPSFVFNGSVLTVHDGKARLTLVAGGQVDICGPAKFTLLQSGPSITLALNFGRIHLQLPASTPLRIFTPTMIATPLDIGGASRDITAGLDMNDSLCVLATSGAIRLEQQFTGAGLIVPQSGEFFLSAGNLVPVAGTPGSCECTPMHVQSLPPPQIPVMGVTSRDQLNVEQYPSEAAPTPAPPKAPPIETAAKAPAPEPNVQLRVLAGANDSHPTLPAPKETAPPPPVVSMPEYKIILPPLVYSASSAPAPPEDPELGAVLLVRTVHVEPDYQFTGHVEAPHLETVSQKSSPSPGKQGAGEGNSSGNKKEGFWARLKRAFGGSS